MPCGPGSTLPQNTENKAKKKKHWIGLKAAKSKGHVAVMENIQGDP